MDSFNQAKTVIAALLTGNSSIGIVVSEHQTIDVLAAALSLHLIFQDSGKSSQIISRKDPTVEHSFLVGIDQLKKKFGGVTKTLTVSFPYHEGDIEKVSYNIEGDRLNVNLFAEEQGISFEEKDIKYIREGSAPQLIFTIGVSNPEGLAGLADGASKIVNIDNNVSNTLFGDAVLVDASYSSLSEIIAKLAAQLSLQVEFDVAQNLLDGITFATQNFMSPKTSPVAFEMIGVLMQKGAVRKAIRDTSRASSPDTSLSMLGKVQSKPFGDTQGKPFGQNQQPKSFSNKPFVNNQSSQSGQQQTKPSFVEPNPTIAGKQPQQPQPIRDQYTAQPAPRISPSVSDDIAPAENIPTEDEAPSDWFVPKVFKSTKNQQ